MKKAVIFTGVLALAGVFLPWFTFNADIMGYYWGYQMSFFLLLPAAYIVFYMWKAPKGPGFDLLWALSLLAFPATCAYAFFTWPIQFNISGEINAAISLYTATPCFWLAAAAVCLFASVGWLYLASLHLTRRKN